MNTMITKFRSEPDVMRPRIQTFAQMLNSPILTEDDWEKFKAHFRQIHHNFFAELKMFYPSLSQAEVRLAALIKLGLFPGETASLLGISPTSAHKARYRLRKKLELREGEELEDVIRRISVS
jgi:hypothetical protein